MQADLKYIISKIMKTEEALSFNDPVDAE